MSSPFSARRAGILCPVFALRAADDLGIGDTAAVRELIDWAAATGLRFLQVLPINATGGDPSPYNAISSVALDPLTLDLRPSAVPEIDAAAFAEALVRHGVEGWPTDRVNYPAVRALKWELLGDGLAALAAGENGVAVSRGRDFEVFRAAQGEWLDDFCLFCVLIDRAGHGDWTTWPEEFNTAERARAWLAAEQVARPEETASALARYAYGQWLCATQWQGLRDHARRRGVGLMGDVPFGIGWCSADVFFQPDQFDLDWSGGAPPETYFKDDLFVQKWGQNWGIPLYRWDVMKADGFRWWRRRVRKLCEVFAIFRIDHLLGFYRIYSFPWPPRRNQEFLPLSEEEAAARLDGRLPHFVEQADDTPEHKAANAAAGDTYLRMILEAADGAEVVAEDLGVVPDYVRPHLRSLDIPGFKIIHWEDDGNGHVLQGAAYDNCTFATYATHDHEPMKTLWERHRREWAEADESEREVAARELRYLCQFAWLHPEAGPYPPYDDATRRSMITALLQSQSRFAALMLTDLFGLEVRFNVPGVAGDQNWSARLPMTVAEMKDEDPWRAEGDWLAGAIRASGRV